MQNYYAMILAGGGGTRLWPMSRAQTPKQLLPLTGDKTMFRISVERLAPLFPPERVYIVTGRQYVDAMRADVPEIPAQNFIVEPYGRDNAAATALGLAVIHQRDPQAVVAILTADHHIAQREKFRDVLAVAYRMAEQSRIVTLGISPSYPATGFGYIQQGAPLTEDSGWTVYEALGFKEKPDAVTAARFLVDGSYTWNSGMFIWKTATAFAEFERQQPQISALVQALRPTIDTPDFTAKLAAIWDEMPKISIDYAIMENARGLAVIPVDIGWSDVGSWASLFEVLELDEAGNSLPGEYDRIVLDTQNTLIVSKRMVVTIGVNDLIVVDTDDAILICHKDRSQDVRDVVNQLRAQSKSQYL